MVERGSVLTALVLGVLALIFGAGIGALFTLAHRDILLLIIGFATIACFLAGLRLVSPGRGPAIAATVGIIAAVAVLGLRGPGGSIVIQDDLLGWVWQLGAVAIAAVAVAWPRFSKPTRPDRP